MIQFTLLFLFDLYDNRHKSNGGVLFSEEHLMAKTEGGPITGLTDYWYRFVIG